MAGRRAIRCLDRKFPTALWRQALADAGVDIEKILHLPCPADAALPWDHIGIRQGREYLEREAGIVGRGAWGVGRGAWGVRREA